jgi:uncharacterized protein DUF5309
MTAPTNTVTSATPNVGVREDLEDNIYRVAPEETPFTSNIGSTKATNIYHEWQTETLATAVATNAQLEGDDYTNGSPNLTTRLGNYVQIVAKAGGVARTQEVVDKAGRASELARQKVLKTIEMKRDFELRIVGNYASVVESGATTRKTAGALAFLTSNTSKGSGGSDGGFATGIVAAATNGTQRTFTETILKSVLSTTFSNVGMGNMPSQLYMGPSDKQVFSTFTGIADIRADASGGKMATIYGAAEVYVSDFGSLTAIPHAYGLTRDVLGLNPKMAAVSTLDGLKSAALAKTGDSEKFLLTMEKGLVIKNEKAHFAIRDLL